MAPNLKEKLKEKKRQGQKLEELEKEKQLVKKFKYVQPMSLADRNRKVAEDRRAELETSPPNRIETYEMRPIEQDNSKNLTSKQVDKLASWQLPKQVDKLTSWQLPKQVDKLTSKQVGKLTTKQVGKLASWQADNIDLTKKPDDLKINQYIILHEIYFNRPFKVSGSNRIGTQYPYGTVRFCLKSLAKKNYINEPFSVNSGEFKGSTCQVNESKCLPLFGPSPIINSEQVDNIARWQVSKLTTKQVDNIASEQVSSSNSSSSLNKNLLLARELEDALQNNPELAYWKRNNLKGRRVENWIAETGISLEEMIESLAHCAFEMIQSDEKDKKGKPITSVFDWFWRRIEKHHYYDRPTGYISAEDCKMERAKKRLAETQARAKEMERIRIAEEAAQMDIRFEEMLKDPEGELYRKCYEGMSSFQKKRTKTPQGLATAMRRRFDKIMEEDVQK